MTYFGVSPLVCPFSIWPGQGFYAELFLICLPLGIGVENEKGHASKSRYLSGSGRLVAYKMVAYFDNYNKT